MISRAGSDVSWIPSGTGSRPGLAETHVSQFATLTLTVFRWGTIVAVLGSNLLGVTGFVFSLFCIAVRNVILRVNPRVNLCF